MESSPLSTALQARNRISLGLFLCLSVFRVYARGISAVQSENKGHMGKGWIREVGKGAATNFFVGGTESEVRNPAYHQIIFSPRISATLLFKSANTAFFLQRLEKKCKKSRPVLGERHPRILNWGTRPPVPPVSAPMDVDWRVHGMGVESWRCGSWWWVMSGDVATNVRYVMHDKHDAAMTDVHSDIVSKDDKPGFIVRLLPSPVPRADSPMEKKCDDTANELCHWGELYQFWGELYHCYNIPHPPLIQHIPRLHIERNIVVLSAGGRRRKTLSAHTALDSTLTAATSIIPSLVHLMQKTHFLLSRKVTDWYPKNTFSALTARRDQSGGRQYKERWRTVCRVSWPCRQRHLLDTFDTNPSDTTCPWYNSPHSPLIFVAIFCELICGKPYSSQDNAK